MNRRSDSGKDRADQPTNWVIFEYMFAVRVPQGLATHRQNQPSTLSAASLICARAIGIHSSRTVRTGCAPAAVRMLLEASPRRARATTPAPPA